MTTTTESELSPLLYALDVVAVRPEVTRQNLVDAREQLVAQALANDDARDLLVELVESAGLANEVLATRIHSIIALAAAHLARSSGDRVVPTVDGRAVVRTLSGSRSGEDAK